MMKRGIVEQSCGLKTRCDEEGLKLEMIAFRSFYGGNLIIINLFDNKFCCFPFSPTQHHVQFL